jgi:hypothetical protein
MESRGEVARVEEYPTGWCRVFMLNTPVGPMMTKDSALTLCYNIRGALIPIISKAREAGALAMQKRAVDDLEFACQDAAARVVDAISPSSLSGEGGKQ